MNLIRVEKIKKSRIFMPWDIPVFAVLVVLTAVLLTVAFTRPKGETAAVYIDSRKVAEYRLTADVEHVFSSTDGKYTLILRIQDGAVSVHDSTCPDHLCSESPAISRVHQSIVCLPARIVVRIEGKSDVDGVA